MFKHQSTIVDIQMANFFNLSSAGRNKIRRKSANRKENLLKSDDLI